jgi:hypothetical protein
MNVWFVHLSVCFPNVRPVIYLLNLNVKVLCQGLVVCYGIKMRGQGLYLYEH